MRISARGARRWEEEKDGIRERDIVNTKKLVGRGIVLVDGRKQAALVGKGRGLLRFMKKVWLVERRP